MVQILVHHVDENNKNIKKRPKDEYLFERWKGFTFLHVAQWSLTYEGSSSLRGYWGCGRWESVEEYIKRDSGMRGLISGWVKTLKRLWTECLIIKKVSENSCECLGMPHNQKGKWKQLWMPRSTHLDWAFLLNSTLSFSLLLLFLPNLLFMKQISLFIYRFGTVYILFIRLAVIL